MNEGQLVRGLDSANVLPGWGILVDSVSPAPYSVSLVEVMNFVGRLLS